MIQLTIAQRLGTFVVTACALAGTCTLVSPALHAAPAAQDASTVRYARANDAGAKIYNLADTSSVVIGAVPKQGLMEVYGERAGFLNVATPAGMEVWVFGQYLRTTETPGIVEVTGDNVFMRPLPASDPSSYPLQQQLDKGVRLRVVGRKDPSKKIGEDWIRVVTPPGARGWVRAADAAMIDAKTDVRTEWLAAVKSSVETRPTYDLGGAKADASKTDVAKGEPAKAAAKNDAPAKNADGAKTAQPAAAPSGGSYEAATALYDAARTNPNADWPAVRAAYQRYLEKSPDGALADAARLQLQRIDLHEEIQRLRNDQTMREAQRKELLASAQQRLAEANAAKDPLAGRFQARGWIVKEQLVASEPPHYFVYWAGQPQAEIVCSNGRYDLANFTDFDVGVLGAVLRPATPGSATASARPARIEVSRLEVLGSRAKAK